MRVDLLIIIVGTLLAVMSSSSSGWAEASGDDAVAESPSEPAQGERRLLPSLLGATPEERERLKEERKRLSAEAKAFGTDPTAIVGYYQLNYGHSTFTNNLRLDTATATVVLPITPNWVFRVNMPYAWAYLNQPRGFTTNGASDMTIRTGGRIYSSDSVALFVGTDASFPTGSNDRLSTGKYILGPGGALAVPLAQVHSLFFVLVQDFKSIGGDPSRANLHFAQVQSSINTIWSERWWTQAIATWDMDWNNQRKTSMNLQGEIGHRFDDHWNVFAGPGVGVVGRDTFLGLDWTVQAGVRWVFMTPLFSERLVEAFPRH
jgi:hypothetical protein